MSQTAVKSPERVTHIPLNASTVGDEEINRAIGVLRSGFFTMGKQCAEYEQAFARYIGSRHAIFVNSGSSANLLALFALTNPLLSEKPGIRRLQPGDEVIVPAVTWSTTIWPIIQAGAIPVFVDSDPTTLQITPAAVAGAIGPRTRAIAAVHVLGNAVLANEIRALADQHQLTLFEDSCESLGVRHQGRQTGTFGAMGSYSFYFSHHITTIEGGMVVTDDDDLADLLRALRAHGWVRHMQKGAEVAARYPEIDSRFLFITTGFNVRPTEINAAFGLEQLPKLDGFNRRRTAVGTALTAGLQRHIAAGHFLPMQMTPGTEGALFGYPIICRDRATRDKLRAHLEEARIETRPIICGNMARQPAMQHLPHRVAGTLAGADRIMDCGLYWGTHPVMSDAEVDYIITTLDRFFAS